MQTKAVKKKIFLSALVYILLALSLAIFLFPIFWMYSTSLKPSGLQAEIPPVWLFKPTLDGYKELFGRTEFIAGIRNTLIISLGSTMIVTITGALAGYSLARVKWKGRDTLGIWFLALWMLPTIIVIIPTFIFFNALNLIDNHVAMMFIYAYMNLPLAVWLIRGYILEIPVDIEEAAQIDGYSRLGVFFRIVLPMAVPGLIAVAILSLILSWNELVAALILTRSNAQTAPVVISGLVGRFGARFDLIMAGGSLLTTPVLILALIIQRYIVRGLTFGAVRR